MMTVYDGSFKIKRAMMKVAGTRDAPN